MEAPTSFKSISELEEFFKNTGENIGINRTVGETDRIVVRAINADEQESNFTYILLEGEYSLQLNGDGIPRSEIDNNIPTPIDEEPTIITDERILD